jgi:hypothetical protein
MNKQIQTALILTPIAFLAAFVIGIAMGGDKREQYIRMEAVRSGHAEWIADSKGQAIFKWKDLK